MGRHVDLDEIFRLLQKMVTTVVNRPSAEGWRRGLLAPEESWMDPEWNAHLHAAALPKAATVEQPERTSEPGSDDPKTPEDYERLAQLWNKLWNS